MNKQIAAITITLGVLLVALCSFIIVSEETDASTISDTESLESKINSIVNQAKNQTSDTTYDIILSDNATIVVDSLLFDFTGINSDVKLNFTMGSKDNGATITISGDESYGLKFINASSSKLEITLKYGTIIDQRTYQGDSSSTLEIVGSGALGGTTTVMTNTLKLVSEVKDGTNVSVISMSGGVSYTSNTSSNTSSDIDGTTGVRMITSNADVKPTSFVLYYSSTIDVVGDGIVSEGNKLSTITLNKETSVISESGNAVTSSNSKVSVKNMTLNAGKSGVYLESGEIAVTGGTISGKESAIDTKPGVIGSISGGKFNHIVDSSLFEENYACSDYPDSEGYYCLSYIGPDAEAKLDGVGYKDVRDAQTAASMITDRTPTITLLNYVGLDDGWSPSFSNDIIIDLNGNNWYMGYTRTNVSGINMEITGAGTITSPADVAFDVRGSTDSNNKDYTVLIIGKDVKIVGKSAVVVFPENESAYGVRIDIAGTLETLDNSYPLCIQGEVKKTGSNVPVINIESTAVIDGKIGTGIYAAGYGIWNIDGKISGATGIELRSGTLNVFDDAEIIATAELFSETPNGSGTTVVGAGIAVSQHTSNPSIQVNIHGGDISGLYALYEKDLQNNVGTDGIMMDITGGTFTGKTASVSSQNVTGFLSGGIFLKENEDGSKSGDKSLNSTNYLENDRTVSDTGSVSLEGAVAKLNDKEYLTIASAIAEANDGDVISLIDYTTESITIPSGVNIILDLGTFTVTNETDKHTITIESGADLTIIGTGIIDNVSHKKAAVYNLGTVTLESGTLTRSAEASTSPSNNGNNSYYVVHNNGTFNMNGGTITQNGYYSSLFANKSENGSTPVFNMTAGTLNQEGFIALKNEETGTVNISGGNVICSEDQSLQNWGTATISGGELTGMVTTFSYTQDNTDYQATTNIEGGIINGDVRSWKYINKDVHANTAPEINVTGGTINGSFEAIERGENGTPVTQVDFAESGIIVSGGTFSEPVPEDCVSDKAIIVPNENGTYGAISTDDADIQSSGVVETPIESDSPTYNLTSAGDYQDVTVTIVFPEGTIVISGDFQKGSYPITLEEVTSLADGMEAGFHIVTDDIVIDFIMVTVQVPVGDDQRMTSAIVYHQAENSQTIDSQGFSPDSFTEDGTIVFTTGTNSYYWIDATLETVQTEPDFPPIWDDDDEYIPPIVPTQPEGPGDDDTTTIVACAAAAVVAALIAAYLIIDRRQ